MQPSNHPTQPCRFKPLNGSPDQSRSSNPNHQLVPAPLIDTHKDSLLILVWKNVYYIIMQLVELCVKQSRSIETSYLYTCINIYIYYVIYCNICIWSVNLMFISSWAPIQIRLNLWCHASNQYEEKHISWVHFGFPLLEPGYFLSSSSASLTAASACCVSSNGQRVRKSVLYDTFEVIHPGQSSYLAAWFSSHGSSKWVAWFHWIFPFQLSHVPLNKQPACFWESCGKVEFPSNLHRLLGEGMFKMPFRIFLHS